MIIKPVLTEKSLAEAKKGKYTFFVSLDMDKMEIKKEAKKLFDIDVVSVKTLKIKPEFKKTLRGVATRTKAKKKAIIEAKEGQKIDLFEEKKEKKGKVKK